MGCGPENEIVVLVVDDRRDSTVRVVLGEGWSLLIARLEFEKDGLIGEAEFFKHDGYFPTNYLALR
jgi:hypothetical protein